MHYSELKKLENDIRRKTNLYPLKRRLRRGLNYLKRRARHQQDPEKLFILETRTNGKVKLIELTQFGISNGRSDHLKKVCRHAELYQDDDCLPEVLYSDDKRLAVEWVEGAPLDRLRLGKEDYFELGRFSAAGLRDVRQASVGSEVDKFHREIRELEETVSKGQGEVMQLKTVVANRIHDPGCSLEAVCFADTLNQNFVRKEDGGLVYVDMIGLQRRSVGSVFAKQLSYVPAENRKTFFDGYRAGFSGTEHTAGFDLEGSLPFYYISFVVAKTLQGQARRTNLRYRRGIEILKQLCDLENKREAVREWIIGSAPVMV